MDLFNMNEKIKMAHSVCLEEKITNDYFGTFAKLITDPSSVISSYQLSISGIKSVFNYLIDNKLDETNTKVAFISDGYEFEYDYNNIEQHKTVDFYLVNTKNDSHHYLFSSVKQD